MSVKIEWTVSAKENGMLLREFLRKEKMISKVALAAVKFNGGQILVNGQETTVRTVVQTEDVITVIFPPEQKSPSLVSEHLPFVIIYEDEHFIVINKAPGMATIPSREHPTGTLANAIIGYYETKGIQSTFHAVNRLDKDTSGILLVAKHRYVHDLLTKEQKKGLVKRTYVAVVHGQLNQLDFTIDAPIGRKEGSIIEREVREDGQQAITHVKILEQLEDRTMVEIQLETGRTHQIRVHLSYKGHPLLGDDLYGGSVEEISRQALHSKRMSFYHPFLHKEILLTAPIPEDIKRAMNR
ncbi:RluA family pseudouridine synthase [Bacillus alkalicellulosilyticus]|uniref:RluA family pseudouridine synthase n=1 Tax=Alkalihalobacterium alkalicellulosilyticum TaxID=1912214 RepID=UPI000996C3BA|nr:RluA family pseudouridine synthase [Bacillus alkalicellulosilyticus]